MLYLIGQDPIDSLLLLCPSLPLCPQRTAMAVYSTSRYKQETIANAIERSKMHSKAPEVDNLNDSYPSYGKSRFMTNSTKTRILVVDDDPYIRNMLQQLLETNDFQVQTAINGIDAIDKYKENPADLIIMDIVMPEKEGIETIIELKNDYPGVKIIAISGALGSQVYLETTQLLGVDCTFSKTFKPNELLEKVKELISPNPGP